MKQTVSLILVVTVAVAVPLQAQRGQADSSHNWANMQTLRPGTKIIVDAEGQGDVRYEFVSADGSALTVVTQAALNASPSTNESFVTLRSNTRRPCWLCNMASS